MAHFFYMHALLGGFVGKSPRIQLSDLDSYDVSTNMDGNVHVFSRYASMQAAKPMTMAC